MKKLEFETSKGRFLLNEEGKGISLKDIPEEQASEIYGSIEELHSLLKSKGIYLFENPIPPFYERLEDFKQAEQKTFYKPYIFKL